MPVIRVPMLAAVGLAIAFAGAARAQTAEEFFLARKELTFITSSNVGGGYDSYTRLLAKHMPRYLPGSPRIVVHNMLGGGGVRATNFLYNVAAKDGTVLALVDRGMPTAPLLFGERSQTRFEAVKFSWIGSLMRETGMGVLSAHSRVKTIADAKVHEIFFGATGPETDPAMYARLVNELLGTKIKVINGYKGQPDQFQAVERKELDGLFMSGWSGPGRAHVRDQMKRGGMRLMVQMSRTRDPDHDDVPTLLELVSAPIDRQIVELQLDRVELGRPFVGPPGVPLDRVAILRAAFDKTVADPDFIADATLQRLALDPMGGADAQKVIEGLYRTPPQVLERLRKIVQVAE